MRRSNWTPSIVPNDNDQTVYLVADDFGKIPEGPLAEGEELGSNLLRVGQRSPASSGVSSSCKDAAKGRHK